MCYLPEEKRVQKQHQPKMKIEYADKDPCSDLEADIITAGAPQPNQEEKERLKSCQTIVIPPRVRKQMQEIGLTEEQLIAAFGKDQN
jgi:hypothetical protein